MRRWPLLLAVPLGALVYWRLGTGLEQARWYVFVLLLAAITETDLRAKLIPDRLTYPGTVLGIGFAAAIDGFASLGLAALGAAVGFTVLEGFRRFMSRLATMEVMGMGDSKLLMMCGAFLGWKLVLLSLLPGTLIGLVFGLVYTRLARSPHFPFGPSLGFGALVTGLFPREILGAVEAFPEALQSMGSAPRAGILVGCVVVLVLLMRRIRRRAADYSRAIEKDYEDTGS